MESKKYSKLSFVEAGLTLIVTPKWMFLAPVFNPYTHNRGMPVYADGYAFAGIMNIQLTQKQWPATAGIVDDQIKLMNVLIKTTRPSFLVVEENLLEDQ